jgi:hypothetical protein
VVKQFIVFAMASYQSESTQETVVTEEMNDTLWSFGWQFSLMCFLAIIFSGAVIYVAGSYWGAAVSLVVIIPWHKGTRLINKNWKNVLNAKLQQAEKAGINQLNINPDEVDIYHLISCSGKAVNIVPNRRYHMAILYVGETFLAMYDGARIDMVNRVFIKGSSAEKLYYRDISSVDNLSPYLMIRTSSGNKLSYKFGDADEESVLKAIRKKLHSVKAIQ